MKRIVRGFFRIFWQLYPWWFSEKLDALLDLAYSERMRAVFGALGDNAIIMRSLKILNGQRIFIGDNFYCYWDVRIEAYSRHNNIDFDSRIVIGNNVSINPQCHIAAVDGVELHDGVMLASRVFITDHFHGDITSIDLELPPAERKLSSKGKVVIGKNVWLGEGVCVMPGVTIGENAIIGANAVVTRDIPENCIAAGCPARIIKRL